MSSARRNWPRARPAALSRRHAAERLPAGAASGSCWSAAASCSAAPICAGPSRRRLAPGDRQLSRAARGRPGGPRRPRHRPLSRPEAAGEGRAGRRAPGAGVPRRHEALRAQLARSSWCRSTSAAAKSRPTLAKLGGRLWGRQKERGRAGRHRSGRPTCSSCRPPAASRPGIAFPADTEWQREFDASFPYHETPDQLTAIDAIKRDMQPAAADGPAAVRRRGLRQDRAGDAGGVQGGRRRLPGGRARADHGAGRAAPPHVHASGWPSFPFEIAALSRFCHARRQQREIIERPGRRLDRHRHRHAPPGAARRAVPQPGPGDHRRGAAVRRRGEGAAQGAAADGRRADDDRHADSAHAAHVAVGPARHLEPGNAAGGPPGRRDARRAVRRRADPPRGAAGAEPRRADLLRPQPRRRHRDRGHAAAADRARGPHRASATARCPSTSWSR